jgi:hypothetical protein
VQLLSEDGEEFFHTLIMAVTDRQWEMLLKKEGVAEKIIRLIEYDFDRTRAMRLVSWSS